jgi:DHA2 family multidrug resistance protein-like MFS transporter
MGIAAALALVTGGLAVVHMLRTREPFLDLRLFTKRAFSGAVLVSLLTGYALATAIVGMASFVDRVRFAGPEEQAQVLGSMAVSVAIGALFSGFALRRVDATTVTVAGLVAGAVGLVTLSTTRIDSDLIVPVGSMAIFGLGFGLTVTPRSSAAVEAAGRAAFGAASAAVTVARMVGMAFGMAVLTAFATTRIDTETAAIAEQAYRDSILPPALAGLPLEDPLVLDAIEHWASAQAAEILGSLFIVAALVLLASIVPAWLMREGRHAPGAQREPGPAGDAEEPAAAGF